jgi:L-fuconolactonase
MGASASIGDLLTISDEELKNGLASLDPAVKARLESSLASERSGRPLAEAAAGCIQNRTIWDKNGSEFYAWLDQTQEQALEPELEIVDPHHHLWDMRELKGFNLFGMFKQQYYMSDELVDDFIGGGHNITSTVFVTTHAFFKDGADPAFMAPLGEVQAVQGIAAQFASSKYSKTLRTAAGIIGTADLQTYGTDVEPLLIACKNCCPNYRGIRCNAAHDPALTASQGNFHPTPNMYMDPKFREGFSLLEKHDLVFDAFIFSEQLDEVRDLAKSFPNTTIVLDHCGSPLASMGNYHGAPDYDGKQAEIITKWKTGLEAIAKECPNVYVKIGGFAIPQVGAGLESRELPVGSEEAATLFKDMVLYPISIFGVERCMLEGNFPVDKVSMSYTVLWNTYKRITQEMSQEDRALLFSGTAKKVYRL